MKCLNYIFFIRIYVFICLPLSILILLSISVRCYCVSQFVRRWLVHLWTILKPYQQSIIRRLFVFSQKIIFKLITISFMYTLWDITTGNYKKFDYYIYTILWFRTKTRATSRIRWPKNGPTTHWFRTKVFQNIRLLFSWKYVLNALRKLAKLNRRFAWFHLDL